MLEYLQSYGISKFRVSAVVFILVLLFLVFVPKCAVKKSEIHDIPPEKTNKILADLIKKQNMNTNEKLWNSCKEGVIKGCVTGGITGGMVGAVSGGALFGIANPLLLYINGNL